MPLKYCEVDGKEGRKWNHDGTCFTGSDMVEKALAEANERRANPNSDVLNQEHMDKARRDRLQHSRDAKKNHIPENQKDYR